ncbi:hypothetical protein [Streptomyces vilmorinianum]|uniref:hypothetical protein n=1 Tax=Streptomyces vilmorinianum TaxID=3051092 RepID=UPI0010FB1629|nr:hypothetical protein [Streptomyces vilmorinianum]
MRPLASSRLTVLAISAAITFGTAAPAVADVHEPSRAASVTARAPLPDATALLAQAEALGKLGSVLDPVTELLAAALKADDGQLPAADVEALKAKITSAIDAAKGAAPVPAPETPAVEAPAVEAPAVEAPAVEAPAVEAPAVQAPAVEAPAVEAPALPVSAPAAAGAKSAVGKAAPADLVGDALATVEKAVAGLLAAVTSGDAAGVVPQVTATLTSLVNMVVATVLGSGLPAPDLAGLPALPALPKPDLPVEAPVELPVKPPLPVR